MYMERGETPQITRREVMQQVQQHHRIHAAGKSDEDVAVCGEERRKTRRNRFS
jgi:hypothetical protein